MEDFMKTLQPVAPKVLLPKDGSSGKLLLFANTIWIQEKVDLAFRGWRQRLCSTNFLINHMICCTLITLLCFRNVEFHTLQALPKPVPACHEQK